MRGGLICNTCSLNESLICLSLTVPCVFVLQPLCTSLCTTRDLHLCIKFILAVEYVSY